MPHEKPKNATSARNSPHSIEKYPFSVLKDPFKANIRELESAIGNLQLKRSRHQERPKAVLMLF